MYNYAGVGIWRKLGGGGGEGRDIRNNYQRGVCLFFLIVGSAVLK